MKCHNCNNKNIKKADYCYWCGEMFTNEEKEIAKMSGFIGLLRKIEILYKKITLDKYFGSMYFKVGLVVGVLLIGIYNIYQTGNEFKIEESENYTYIYNPNEKEYYLYVETDETALNMYLPYEVDNFYVSYYDQNDQKLSEEVYTNEENIILNSNMVVDNYYKISYDMEENDKNTLKLYVYRNN